MTTTMTDAERLSILDDNRRWLAEQPPLPTAEELAAPFIHAIYGLNSAFDGRASSMEFHFEAAGEYLAEATQLVATIERVASLVRTAIGDCLEGEARYIGGSASGDMDAALRALAGSRSIERLLDRAAIEAIVYPEVPVPG